MKPLFVSAVLKFLYASVQYIGRTPRHSTVTYLSAVASCRSPLNWATPPEGALRLTIPPVELSEKEVEPVKLMVIVLVVVIFDIIPLPFKVPTMTKFSHCDYLRLVSAVASGSIATILRTAPYVALGNGSIAPVL